MNHVSQDRVRYVYPQQRGYKKYAKRCHFCGRYGHIRHFLYRLYGYPQSYSHPRLSERKGNKTRAKKVWKPKEYVKFLLAHVSLRGSSKEVRYFDSG